MTRPLDVFAVARGQYENVGDVLLRRPLLRWARQAGRLHVYVGASPAGYDEGLDLQPDDVVYRSFGRWYAALLRAAAAGRAASVFKPGEIQLTLVGTKEHVAMLPAVALVRARGGAVVRVGAGARGFAPLPRLLVRPSVALTTYTRWRDERTAAYLGGGPAAPDLGVAEGSDDATLRAARDDGTDRDVLVLSLRTDVGPVPRPYPPPAALDAVARYAAAEGLRIHVVTQVRVDGERSQRLAADLGAELLDWPADLGHDVQEERLRAVYRGARVVLSDRLHVLIAALTEGAAPVPFQLDGSDKAARHLDTIGVHDVTVRADGRTADELVAALRHVSAQRSTALDALLHARERLRGVQADVVRVLGGRPSLVPDRVSVG
ncbi:polysaccharide pyruvyl transferase family protein [Cellulomonas sp.]|uniref:polysaccharide pyruvyl transferase family protein n=1 Tax=Cellulomonas sp. TaxID=40001 RepID=UPI0028127D4E|nr:polysaccharide pyruvyl transferase family protein [Cellulomonas sp.]